MSYFNKQGNGANTLNTTDIVANSISVIRNINGVDTIIKLKIKYLNFLFQILNL